MPTEWLSEHEHAAWRTYNRMRRELSRALADDLEREAGLSSADYELLVVLSESADHRLRARDLRAVVEWDRSRLAHQMRRMEARGLIGRTPADGDGRGVVVHLTAAGLDAIRAAAPGHVAAVRRYFVEAMSATELRTIQAVSQRILDRLEGG
jgi:DNA-binding MarR family transcriptional regulator